MQIKDFYGKGKPVFSFEVFPPKENSSLESILDVLEVMTNLKPDFMSVTYGASGNSKSVKYSQMIASIIKNQYDTEALFHLTCVNSSRKEIGDVLERLKKLNIENILALRGDPPSVNRESLKKDYEYATNLIAEIKAEGDFCIGAACYPEGHITCETRDMDVKYMKEKQDAGADFFVSQLFFENRFFYDFLEHAHSAGISKPIVAGVMPILGKNQVDRMIYMCGVSLPSEIIKILHKHSDNPEDLQKAGLEYAIKQAEDLLDHGVDGVHLYTMNRPQIAQEVTARIGNKL